MRGIPASLFVANLLPGHPDRALAVEGVQTPVELLALGIGKLYIVVIEAVPELRDEIEALRRRELRDVDGGL